jgi:predicted alpha/beta hydrolase family esterase
MKRAVILHGTDSNPQDIWFPWFKNQLEANGYTVFVPLLPDNHTPNRKKYEEFLKNSNWDFRDNILIGHSSGATTALNLLSADWLPKVKAVVLF